MELCLFLKFSCAEAEKFMESCAAFGNVVWFLFTVWTSWGIGLTVDGEF